MSLNKSETKVYRLDHKPSLKEAQELVGGYVEMKELRNGDQILFNEEGKLMGLPVNVEATDIFTSPGNYADYIVGNAIILSGENKWV